MYDRRPGPGRAADGTETRAASSPRWTLNNDDNDNERSRNNNIYYQ